MIFALILLAGWLPSSPAPTPRHYCDHGSLATQNESCELCSNGTTADKCSLYGLRRAKRQ